MDKMSNLDFPAMFQQPSLRLGLERFVTTVCGNANTVTGTGCEVLIPKGQGYGTSTNIGMNVAMLHVLLTTNGSKVGLFVWDQAPDQKNTIALRFCQLLVDLSFFQRVVCIFTPAYHGKHTMDRLHSLMRTAVDTNDVMSLDAMAEVARMQPNLSAGIANPENFADLGGFMAEVYGSSGPPQIQKMVVWMADSHLDGEVLLARDAEAEGFYRYRLRPAGVKVSERLNQLQRVKPEIPTAAACSTARVLGPNSRELSVVPGDPKHHLGDMCFPASACTQFPYVHVLVM